MTVSDEILDQARNKLYTAVISDTLDGMGILSQALPPGVRPLDESLVLCGRARTGLYMPVYHDDEALDIYEHEIALVDDLRPGDVAVFSCAGNTWEDCKLFHRVFPVFGSKTCGEKTGNPLC